ncbi:MAG: PorP/SprF family type IX secretion system membrane protein [Bacteroidales bacterium]|nr:PorP/SprF family type IX secretion system membrane protein [Bacteroidales bacterium]
MRSLLIIALIVFANLAKSQDIHYSQFLSSPINLNPSLAGSFNNDYRLVMNHRNQWQSVTVPFRTFSAAFDTRITSLPISKSFIGAGLQINSDRAGDSRFGTQQVKLVLSFHRILKSDSSMIISGGIAGTYNYHSIDYNSLYYGSQYDGHQYNPSLPNNEIFGNDRLSYFDFETGLMFYHVINEVKMRYGISFNHLNKPLISFEGNEQVELYRKFNFFAQSEFNISEQMKAFPSILFLRQGQFQEIMIGGLLRQRLNHIAFNAFYFGGWLRWKDALVLKIGMDYFNLNLGISYDINISKLVVASNSLGGLELSLIYIFGKRKKYEIPVHMNCPVFM